MDKAAEQTKAEVESQPGVSEAEVLARKAEKEARKRDFDEAVRKSRPKDALDGLGSGLVTAGAGILGGVCGSILAYERYASCLHGSQRGHRRQ